MTLLKTCRPCRRHGPQKAKSNCSLPLIYTNYREDKQKLRSWKKEKDCREVCSSRKLEVGKGQGKKSNQNFVRSRWGAKINQYSEPPKLQSPLKPESGSWQNSWWIGLMSEEWNKTQHMSEPEVLGLCVILPPMDAMCASGRSCCAAPLSTPQGHF